MSRSQRQRASLFVLLLLAGGLVGAATGAAFAASAHEMACCPEEAAAERGCAWLGAGDCCPERPAARSPATPSTTPSATAAAFTVIPPAFGAAPAAPLASCAAAPHLSRSAVLRL